MAEPTNEQKKETWLNWLAITTIIFSAAATLSSFRGGGLSTRAVLAQSKASDNWAFYQAKSIKEHTYKLQLESMKLEAMGASGEQAAAFQKKIDEYAKEVARYKQEKADIDKEARQEEAIRNRSQDIGGFFGVAIPYLQVAITLSALAALLKKRPVWILGSGVGAVGLYYFIVGYWYFYH
jgi:hypothetical protein